MDRTGDRRWIDGDSSACGEIGGRLCACEFGWLKELELLKLMLRSRPKRRRRDFDTLFSDVEFLYPGQCYKHRLASGGNLGSCFNFVSIFIFILLIWFYVVNAFAVCLMKAQQQMVQAQAQLHILSLSLQNQDTIWGTPIFVISSA